MELLTSQPLRQTVPEASGEAHDGLFIAARYPLLVHSRSILVWLALLPGLSLLSDAYINPASLYDHVWETFLNGYLSDAQEQADRGYQQFRSSNPIWARKFQLLEATAMRWRSLNEDLLQLIADDQIPWADPDDVIQKLAMEAYGLTKTTHLPEANLKLTQADKLCAIKTSPQCGGVLYSHGIYNLARGKDTVAKNFFLASQRFASANNDGILQAQSLVMQGRVASDAERHDEALEFYRLAHEAAKGIKAAPPTQWALSGEGWEQYSLGNLDKALDIFNEVEKRASLVGNTGDEIHLLTNKALVYEGQGRLDLAEETDLRAIQLARKINQKQAIIDASMDLARFYIGSQRPAEADRYAGEAWAMAQETGSQLDMLNSHLYGGEAAAQRRDLPHAEMLLREVSTAADSQRSMKWEAERALANLYEAQGDTVRAEHSYKAALALVESARSDLQQEVTQLTFLSNAAHIYDDYVHFLVTNGKSAEALQAADWSRARTLQQGLGLISSATLANPPAFDAAAIAHKAKVTLLFYWLGERQSYLWTISDKKTVLIPLPARAEISNLIERYRRTVMALKDPLKDSGESRGDGKALYDLLIAPASGVIVAGRPVVIFAEGEMSELNLESLVVSSPTPHYWIDDATVLSAPSIRLFAASKPSQKTAGKLLVFGDPISPEADYPDLPMAGLEVEKVKSHLSTSSDSVFTRQTATPKAYLASKPERYNYIHFVSHGVASRADPLDSAVILSRGDGGEDSYKLYARDILRHPIDARLVTISACNSSGSKAIAGEGLVGLSWAFLRAGAHNAIGALWEVSDGSTPQLMDQMYSGLEQGKSPAEALRSAKLQLIHSGNRSAKPFYWAPFQLYVGR